MPRSHLDCTSPLYTDFCWFSVQICCFTPIEVEARIKLSYSKKLMLIPISLSYPVLLPFISLSFSLSFWRSIPAWQTKVATPARNRALYPVLLGVAESHAVKTKKKDRNRAILAIYSNMAAAKSHKRKQEKARGNKSLPRTFVAAHSVQLQATCG